jgi:hypothetical protein
MHQCARLALTYNFEDVRETANHYSNGPVTSVTDQAIRCYELDYSLATTPTSTVTVNAGASLGISAVRLCCFMFSCLALILLYQNGAIYHPGSISVYMAKASNAASSSAGTDKSWFKSKRGPCYLLLIRSCNTPAVYQNIPTYSSSTRQLTFPSTSLSTISFTIPKNVPSGQYLVRAEQVALHAASSYGGAQFYISCAQVNVVNGGSGSPGPLVSFPGAYTGYEPGLMLNIYNLPANYVSGPRFRGDKHG